MNNFTHYLNYFNLLKTYEQKDFLEVNPDKHEAYITQAALFTLSDHDGGNPPDTDRSAMLDRMKSVSDTLFYLRAYAAWKSQQGAPYLHQPFALHVVKEPHPHDLLYTLLISRHRVWWKLFLGHSDQIEVITY